MSSRGNWKLLGVIIVVLAVAGAVGWQQFTPKPLLPATITVTPAATTVTASQATVKPSRPTEWIQVGQVKPIKYYLALLESNGTQPYVQLANELRKLPDLTNATAVAKITFLALNATNPEVKEAFELMIKGGTPDPRDFSYVVPTWNTELQVLYWLACQNEFKKDDTLAMAIAMVNGFWVTMGDGQVVETVRRDACVMLDFGRKTSEWQRTMKLSYNLDEYPLEAKVCWAWTGNDPGRGGHYIIYRMYSGKPVPNPTGKCVNLHPPIEYKEKKLGLKGYLWNTIDPNNLPKMRQFILDRKWFEVSMRVSQVVASIDRGLRATQNYTSPDDDFILVHGETTINHNMNNADFEFECLLSTGRTIGVCDDQATIADAFLKSIGIPSNLMIRTWPDAHSHTHIFYYDMELRTWSTPSYQLIAGSDAPVWNVYFVRPPIDLHSYLSTHRDSVQPIYDKMLNSYYLMERVTPYDMRSRFEAGIVSSLMKQWLLYS